MNKFSILFLLSIVLIAGCTQISMSDESQTSVSREIVSEWKIFPACKGNATCFNGTVTKITDGDTLDVNNITIRLALVNCPEYYDGGYEKAKDFVSNMCPVGSIEMVDEDDGQTEGSFNRTIAVVYCNGKNLNEELLEKGYCEIDKRFCDVSEFGDSVWAVKFGC